MRLDFAFGFGGIEDGEVVLNLSSDSDGVSVSGIGIRIIDSSWSVLKSDGTSLNGVDDVDVRDVLARQENGPGSEDSALSGTGENLGILLNPRVVTELNVEGGCVTNIEDCDLNGERFIYNGLRIKDGFVC